MTDKKVFFLLLLIMCCFTAGASAVPGFQGQLELIADNADLWKQDYEYIRWGYIVTDLDHNGRLEIISASLQGTGMYTYFNIFEVSEDGSRLDVVTQDRPEYDSAPDIMIEKVKVYLDEDSGRYNYVFTDFIRNGYAESYENKRAVWLEDGVWKETPLAFKTVLYTDAEHFTETYEDASRQKISEEAYLAAEDDFFKDIAPSEVCLNWQMTDAEEFASPDRTFIVASLEASASPECPAE